MGYDLPTEFPYEKNEYVLVLERLQRMTAEAEEGRDEIVGTLGDLDPHEDKALLKVYQASRGMTNLIHRAKWAKTVLDQFEDKVKEDGAINEHGHYVRDDDVPWLFYYLQKQRRELAKKLIDQPRQQVPAGYDQFFVMETMLAMTTYINDFQAIAPSLRNIKFEGNEDPLLHTL